ncbi:hypothetical protein GCM10010435_16850 [Winogradskya consettensis]|uniref:GH26 domain-containing protein n=1 Tax=Winogradskya consettensis TaxID=113560 RepID=A0A919SW75_9ACTN|nr:glycosyl hydrolase [Actinoplanes consettensis]GIM78784.1 hypothetical protein Aco04nite_62200 [Actinoplanes consettensis]
MKYERVTRRVTGLKRYSVRIVAATLAVVVAGVAVFNAVTALPYKRGLTAVALPSSDAVFGAYLGPAAKGANGLLAWQQFSLTAAPYALDFSAGDSWESITGPEWMLKPWQRSGRRLIYSLAMFPHQPADAPAVSELRLSQCATGAFDLRWVELGRNLMGRGMSRTILRPGWEFDGSWYPWAAHGRKQSYVNCFRRIVTAMRSIPGQKFQFLWNPAGGVNQFAAEEAYPGDGYVNFVGVDVYDVSWASNTYPVPAGASEADRQARSATVWSNKLNGRSGLRFWADFAAAHGKRLVIPEWGLSKRLDGRGGGDNPEFVANMIQFIQDPRNGVAFALYFDADSAHGDLHRLSSPTSPFPKSRDRFRRMMERVL